MAENFAEFSARISNDLRPILDSVIPKEGRLAEAMRYAALNGGKAFRPALVCASGFFFGGDARYLLRVGAAIEMIHTYSLIHDDLPAMDNSHLRRGRPSVHCAFDEATAILAGDGLLTDAFGVLSDAKTHPDAAVRCRLVSLLATAAGSTGMAGGQMDDIIGQAATPEAIHALEARKTGALIAAASAAGGIVAEAKTTIVDVLHRFGLALGWLFQITDDILDYQGTTEKMGKPTGQDTSKSTLVRLWGIAGAQAQARHVHSEARQILSGLDRPAPLLQGAADFALHRMS
ncbi:MAG: polyprenyl synthetase family protein [Holosporales bacterium]|jgi:farnesyl diphosphate synthase